MAAHRTRKIAIVFVSFLTVIGGSQTKAPRITEDPTDVTVLRNDPATLRCGVSGVPQPEITWYREGDEVEQRGHRLLLPDGSLFFLRVTQGRGRGYGDAGVYWCVARNAAGVARSKNATLTVAYLQPDFRLVPVTTKGIVGENVILQCQAPRGVPEPEVTWRKNGQPIRFYRDESINTQRTRLNQQGHGDLVIRNSEPTDEGEYQCIAQNMAGTRESPVVKLTMHVRPRIIESPDDIVTAVGSDAVFECNAVGDPHPQIIWRRLDAPLPAGRARPTESRTGLKIERVTLNDSGKYVCEAENPVGSDSAIATLKVLTPPEWLQSPPDQFHIQEGDNGNLDCSAQGIPPPLVSWRKEGLFPRHSSPNTNWEILSNGTLRILNASLADSGALYCMAVNEAGAILSRVSIQVTSRAGNHPPVFLIGPANQTLPVRSQALLQCKSDANATRTTWTKNGSPLNQTSRMSFVSDSLTIEQLDYTDAGDYSCVISSSNNTTSVWTGRLSVESPVNPNIAFNRAPSDPLALPGPPSQPEVQNKSETSITLLWQSSSRMGASPLLGYTIEIFTPNCGHLLPPSWSWEPAVTEPSGWRILARRHKANTFTLTGLETNCWLVFAVRAENSHGLSEPSLSSWLQISAAVDIPAELTQVREFLQNPLVQLQRVTPVNSSSIQLEWEIIDGESYIEGLGLFYTFNSADDGQFVIIEDPSASSHVLTDLKADTNYTFFLIPFYGALDGRPSNSKWTSTMEDAPSGHPLNLSVRQFNNTSLLVQWLPPPPSQRNGVITGYQIIVRLGLSGPLLANLTLPATPTSVAVGGLESGSIYAVEAAAWTRMGLGPPSEPQTISMVALASLDTPPRLESNNEKPHRGTVYLSQETMLILLIGGSLILILIAVIIVVIVRRRTRKSLSNSNRNAAAAQLWIHDAASRASKEIDDAILGASLEYAELFQQPHHGPGGLSNEDINPNTPAAYATTTIFRRAAPLGRPAIPNLTELLPPPPQYPPPPPFTMDNRRVSVNTGPLLVPIAAGTLPSSLAGFEKRNHGLYRISNTQSQPAIDSFRGYQPALTGNRNSSFHLQESPHADTSDDDTYARCLYEQIHTVPHRIPKYS